MHHSIYRFLGFSVVALAMLAGSSGCVAATDLDVGDDVEEADEEADNESVGTVEQPLSSFAATFTNLSRLQQGCWSSTYLLWDGCTGKYGGKDLDAPHKKEVYVGAVKATQTADNYGSYWGECVSFVKAMTKSNVGTFQWSRGVNVMANGSVAPGTAIATFFGVNNTYFGHAAIFAGYKKDLAGNITAIKVYDQNWVERVVRKHNISINGTPGTTSDADAYYVITVP